MKSYVNNSGKRVIISKMPDSYLVNSYLYCQKRMKLVEEKAEGKTETVNQYLSQLKERAKALSQEIKRRKLAVSPS